MLVEIFTWMEILRFMEEMFRVLILEAEVED